MKDCYMEFHFHHPFLTNDAVLFKDPVTVVRADHLRQVMPCLRELEDWTDKGYYAAGYISYEAAPAFDEALQVRPDHAWPLLYFGVFSDPLPVYDRERPEKIILDWRPETGPEKYKLDIQEIHRQIAEGNTYQANYTMRLSADCTEAGYDLFQQLRQSQQADYCAYLQLGSKSILSASPECFFAWDGTTIMAKPMKGTIARGMDANADEANKTRLRLSKKDQAENVMIVDLLRNDLGRIAETGTVRVPKLFEIETYPTVFQMTSTVEVKTRKGTALTDIFKALFPCGSITGAPKVSTMALIRRLEKSPREVYCGAIGYIEPGKAAVFNVPIRTVLFDDHEKKARYGVGGGITWDSTPEGEYEETLAKANVLKTVWPPFDLLESLRLEDGHIVLLEKHLSRMKRSAGYFRYPFDENKVRQSLLAEARRMSGGLYKMRLLAARDGRIRIESKPIKEMTGERQVCFAAASVSSQNLFLYHKTTHRSIYDKCKSGDPSDYDTLLWNEKGHVTEFTNGNVVCKIDGKLLTPPVEDGLLAGTFREQLIEAGKISAHSLSLEQVKQADAIWLINSVRGWVPVTLAAGEKV